MRFLSTLALPFVLATPVTNAQDWPAYLGDGTAIVKGTMNGDWKSSPPKTLWKKEIGKGCTSWAIANDRAIVGGNDGKQDTWWCFDAPSGDLLWKHSYKQALDPKLYEGGPNCTPTIDDGLVYTLSKTGKLFCLKLSDGTVAWEKDLANDFAGRAPDWGYSASPTIHGDLLLTLPSGKKGALYALDKKTGKTVWNSTNDARPGYAAPVITKLKGTTAALVFHGRNLLAYDLDKNGAVLFDQSWRTPWDVNASNPQLHNNKLFIASGYGMGYAVVDVSGSKPKMVHKESETRMIFQNSLLVDGDIIGVFGDKNIDAELIRMDLASGDVRWKVKLPGTRGSSLLVGDQLVCLLETGDLLTGTATKDKFTETGRLKILDKRCWSSIAYANGRLFARNNNGQAVCLDASK
ncbi:MAG: PQQ-like beta-propeller repeat protein [Verrucomicrobia bacterium]|nr:PQQ-like beta-propeller repeat protein [Verrucomicrobiota bacterium]MDA1007161.1 PQQ-like beta-propeller repeat protein [Verrucomicrobiota bacterium]